MYKYLIFPAFILFLFSTQVDAQRGPHSAKGNREKYSNDSTNNDLYTSNTPAPVIKPSRDFVMLALTYNNWVSKPDSIKTRPFNYGFNGHICYDFPIKKSKMSFATGIGVKVSAMYLDQQVLIDTATSNSVTAAAARFIPDTLHYKRYKFVSTYLSAPFEIRYFSNTNNRNRGFKAALGLEIGTLLGADTKGVKSIDGTLIKDKVSTKRFLSSWDFSATMRVGWGNFCFFGSYNLTPVFKLNMGPPITPASVGFCLVGL